MDNGWNGAGGERRNEVLRRSTFVLRLFYVKTFETNNVPRVLRLSARASIYKEPAAPLVVTDI